MHFPSSLQEGSYGKGEKTIVLPPSGQYRRIISCHFGLYARVVVEPYAPEGWHRDLVLTVKII
jgi:hypothetical protein